MNTIGTGTYGASYRTKYFKKTLQETLKRSLIANAICDISRSGEKYIQNPYSSQPTAAVQAVAGTYSVSAWTITDDTLTVADEFTYGEHIFDFEEELVNYSVMADRQEKISYAIKAAMDIWAVNTLCEDGTGTYDTPSGGFTTPSNIPVIIAGLMAKFLGYDMYTPNGIFLVVEAGDTVGFTQFSMGAGWSFADAALKNGWIGSVGGIDIFVVLDSTFQDATTTAVSGSKTWTNSGHRVAGLKGVATFSVLDGKWEEKGVSGKTGKEVCGYAYAGLKVWANVASMIVDVTVTA